MSGPKVGDGKYVWQSWSLISDDWRKHRRYLSGVLMGNTKISGDKDWNFFVRPDAGYRPLLINDDGDENPPRTEEQGGDKSIELEVQSGGRRKLPLIEKFPGGKGVWVQAYGWWVQDHAHGERTELHPLICAASLD